MDQTDEQTDSNVQDNSVRQVNVFPPIDNVSCSGSVGNNMLDNPRAQLRLAELEEEHVRQELELEHRQRVLQARNRTELARLRLELSEMDVTSQLPVSSKFEPSEKQPVKSVTPVKSVDSSPAAVRLTPVMPRVELQYFDGNPCHYWKFIRQFENFIECNVCDDGQRMLYLLHYCRGQARHAIDGCSMLVGASAYKRAREILNDLYGQPHVIARSLIDDLVSSVARSRSEGRSLTEMSIQMQNTETALTQMNCEADLDSLATLELIASRLPHSLQVGWARSADVICKNGCNPTFHDLQEFVTGEARIARSRFGYLANRNSVKSAERPVRDVKRVHNITHSTSQFSSMVDTTCYVCGKEHSIRDCKTFETYDVRTRWHTVKKHRACFVCLRKGHRAEECKESSNCTVAGCTGKHSPLLHVIREVKNYNAVRAPSSTESCCDRVRLGIFPVTVFGPKGSFDVYAMLDNGADVSLVKESLLSKLGIETTREEVRLRTLNSVSKMWSGSAVLAVGPLGSKTSNLVIKRALSVPVLPDNNCCAASKDASIWPHLRDLDLPELADSDVSLLIGADVPDAHWVMDQRRGSPNEPFAYRTLLGWVVLGPVTCIPRHEKTVLSTRMETNSISEQLLMMYNREFDDSASCEQQLSRDEEEAMQLVEHSCRLSNGRFEIGLPWKKNSNKLCDNREQAYSRLRGLRARFVRDPVFFQRYKEVIERNLSLGYSTRVPADQMHPDCTQRWYLPHHAVINPKKPEKLRVVHDCAAKFKGISLNDCLHQGPDTLRSLVGVLLRFRKETIALSGDIEEMFMQVSVPAEDRASMRYLWWPQSDIFQDPVEYQMAVHPFGAVSSPFVANFALRRTTNLCEGTELSLVTEAIRNNFYVDDLLISIADVNEAATFVEQLSRTLLKGGFRIRKWLSNSQKALKNVAEADLAHPNGQCSRISPPADRTLGMEWLSATDEFQFSYCPVDARFTRRGLLSIVASLFDPLGLVAPLVLPAKLLLQKLCREKLDWDSELNVDDVKVWKKWVECVQQLKSLRIPRCIKHVGTEVAKVQMHVFCDASEVGYGALVYIRMEPESGRPYCSMVYSKSRVAPVKSVTIPRLELAAAKLGIVICSVVKKEISWNFEQTYFWTDSNIVLHYINNTSTRFSTFVSNRLAVIHQYSSPSQWRHVRSEDNPADLVSRGTYNICELRRWLSGPSFLESPESDWPLCSISPEIPPELELKRGTTRVNVVRKCNGIDSLLAYHSSWVKLKRSVAWLSRYKTYIMKGNVTTGELAASELDCAERDILKIVQNEVFGDTMTVLLAGRSCDKAYGSRLRKLNPVLVNGLICLKGRLSYTIDSDSNLPIILPRRHVVTDLIVRFYHTKEGHSGAAHVLSAIRERYWILQGGAAVKRIIGQCIVCRRLNARKCQQQMAPLPNVRVETGGYPFEHVGIDYFGPFRVKRARSLEKRYGCVFSCLQSRAVHFELASSLNTDSFIMVLTRFIARRGVPKSIHSDNGTNFVGAQKELRECIQKWTGGQIEKSLASRGIEWHFNPPYASHRGGVWERTIRSARKILFTLGSEQALTDETLSTLLVEAERILNNRPLVPASSTEIDDAALTPNHLLLLRGNSGLPVSTKHLYTRGYKQALYLADVFWRRWLKEYLPTLQTRQKWLRKHRNLKVGDLVLVTDEATHRGTWPLGKIVECYTSQDGLVRQVDVRTRGVVMRRDIRRLCLLEADEEESGERAPEVDAARGADLQIGSVT